MVKSRICRIDYWKSRAIDFDRIRCPFYAVSGWADSSYVGAVSEALTKLKVPRKGLIGPWGLRFPYLGAPNPAIGFLQKTLRCSTTGCAIKTPGS